MAYNSDTETDPRFHPERYFPGGKRLALLFLTLLMGVAPVVDSVQADSDQPTAAAEMDEERLPQEDRIPLAVRLITEILDGELPVDQIQDGDVYYLDGEQFFEHFHEALPADELSQLFLVDEEGDLLYSAGLEVSVQYQMNPVAANGTTSLNSIVFSLDHRPVETKIEPGGSDNSAPITAGGIAGGVAVAGDSSERHLYVAVPAEGTRRFMLRVLDKEGNGQELTGGYPEGQTDPIIWKTPFTNGEHGQQEPLTQLPDNSFDALSLVDELSARVQQP